MTHPLLSLLGWSFLPSLVTGWLQTIWYAITIRAGDRKPTAGSPHYTQDRRWIQALVVGAYLAYTLYEAWSDVVGAPTFYVELGIGEGAPEREIKARFRRLAVVHHPDKPVGGGAAGEALFLRLRTAAETLQDGGRRFAYDRFGPDVVAWRGCSSVRDYVGRAVLTVLAPHYAVAAAMLYLLALLGYLPWGRYPRWLALLGLGLFEVLAATRPGPPAPLAWANHFRRAAGGARPILAFQAVAVARRLAIALSIGLAQLGPLLRPPRSADAAGPERALQDSLARLEGAARAVDAEANRLWELDMAPFVGSDQAVFGMRAKVRDWLVQNTIRSDPSVRDALGEALRKRRVDAPMARRETG